jgi:ubiquinone/menaquinone biosynthesis C-methylase UbiE
MEFLRTEHDFWDNIAKTWSVRNKNPVVGWYDYHNQWPDYETVLFDGIETKGKVALEYGCGPARNIIRFGSPESRFGFARIDGVDISQTNIENGRINLVDVGYQGPQPNLWQNDGCHIEQPDNSYDLVFSVIALQHVLSHPIRQIIMGEIHRVLKPGGWFTAQMGFGPGHPRSVDYYHVGSVHEDKDVRVESADALEADLKEAGLENFRYVLRTPCKDEHPHWIWFQCQKAS